MPEQSLIFVPYDGSRERIVSAAEAKSKNIIDDPVRETRFSELLEQRGMQIPFWLTDRGVLIQGSSAQAMTVSHFVEQLPHLVPSSSAYQAREIAPVAANDDHIKSAFGAAVVPYAVPPMAEQFKNAAYDNVIKPLRFGQRATISGSYLRVA